METNKLNVMTYFDDFINSNEWNEVELYHMCETIRTGHDVDPFKILPANHSKENVILVFVSTGDALILKPRERASFIPNVEEKFCNGESYDIYFSCKMAVEKDD